METLNAKERAAVELRYLGNTYPQIAKKIEVPQSTIEGWFKDAEGKGRLRLHYQKYVERMQAKRQKVLEDEISLTDKEVFTVTTNVARRFAQKLQGRKVPLTNRGGELIYDKQGEMVMVEERVDVSMADLERAWRMQRIMRGLPISVERQEIKTEPATSYEDVAEALGMTAEDFKEEKYDKTVARIARYLDDKED